LRILITRTAARDGVKRAQQMLDEMGYYIGAIDGAMGRNTRAAIKEFQVKSGRKDTGKVNDELLQALVEATGGPAEDDKNGRIFIRQGYRDIYEAPISITDIDAPLGTHVFTSMNYGPDRTGKISWTALTVAAKERRLTQKSSSKTRLPFRIADANTALARIKIPENVRAYIEERLMPGSSLIISDNGSSHETGEGTDFIVLTK
jgi:peptidoglycan hydrolase-like protein with peptidoglycan-binding domain